MGTDASITWITTEIVFLSPRKKVFYDHSPILCAGQDCEDKITQFTVVFVFFHVGKSSGEMIIFKRGLRIFLFFRSYVRAILWKLSKFLEKLFLNSKFNWNLLNLKKRKNYQSNKTIKCNTSGPRGLKIP